MSQQMDVSFKVEYPPIFEVLRIFEMADNVLTKLILIYVYITKIANLVSFMIIYVPKMLGRNLYHKNSFITSTNYEQLVAFVDLNLLFSLYGKWKYALVPILFWLLHHVISIVPNLLQEWANY